MEGNIINSKILNSALFVSISLEKFLNDKIEITIVNVMWVMCSRFVGAQVFIFLLPI